MTEQEYKDKVHEFDALHKTKITELATEYINENKRFSIGDILAEYGIVMLVEKIIPHRFYMTDTPRPMYCGRLLTAKLAFRKDGSKGSILEGEGVTLIKKAADHTLK